MQSLRLHFETREAVTPFMYIFAEPVTEEQIEAVQSSKQARIEKFENEVLGLKREVEGEHEEDKRNWEDIEAKVQEEINKDESGVDELAQQIGPDSIGVRSDVPDGHDDQGSVDTDRAGEDGMKGTKELQNTDGWESDLEAGKAEELSDTLSGTLTEVTDVGHQSIQELPQPERQENAGSEAMVGAESAKPIFSNISTSELPDSALSDDVAQKPVAAAEPNAQSEDELVSSDSSIPDSIETSKPPSATSLPISSIGSALITALMDSASEGLSVTSQADAEFLDDLDDEHTASLADVSQKPLLAMTLTIRNKVNGKYVLRPENLSGHIPRPSIVRTVPHKADTWSIEYSLGTVNNASRAWNLYRACQLRRKKRLDVTDRGEDGKDNVYLVKLRELAKQGRRYRRALNKQDEESGRKKVVWGGRAVGRGWHDGKGGTTKMAPRKGVPQAQQGKSEGVRKVKAQEEGKAEGEKRVLSKTQEGEPEGQRTKMARNARKHQKVLSRLKLMNKKKATDE